MKNNIFIIKNYSLIWSGKLVSMVGDRFYTLVLALWVLEKSKSPSIMGFVLVASALPAFLISFVSGAYVDLKNKKNILIITDMIRGLLITIVAYLEFLGILEVWHIIVVSITVSLLNAFFDPAIKSLIPEVVDEKDLPNANALEQLISGISNIIGPILGAIAIGFIGFFGGFLINGISFIVSAIFEMLIDAPHVKKEKRTKNSYKDDIIEGFLYVLQKQSLIKVLIIIAIIHFAVGSFSLILPFLSSSISDSEMNLGFLQGFLGIGMVIGATKLNIKNFNKTTNNLLILLVLILGTLYFLVGALGLWNTSTLIPYLIVVAFIGLVISNAATFWQLILQLETPANLRGRVFGIVSMLANISIPIAYAAIGILLEYMDFSIYLIILGCTFVLLSFLWRNSFNN